MDGIGANCKGPLEPVDAEDMSVRAKRALACLALVWAEAVCEPHILCPRIDKMGEAQLLLTRVMRTTVCDREDLGLCILVTP